MNKERPVSEREGENAAAKCIFGRRVSHTAVSPSQAAMAAHADVIETLELSPEDYEALTVHQEWLGEDDKSRPTDNRKEGCKRNRYVQHTRE